MRCTLNAACWLALLTFHVSPLPAQDRSTRFTADLGFVNAAGNTAVTSFNFGERLTHTSGAWQFQQSFATLYGRTDGEPSAEQFRVNGRVDFAFSERIGVYGLAGWDRNRFAGIRRRFEEGAGLAVKALAGSRNELSVEAGLGATQQINTQDDRRRFLTGRAASRFKHLFTETAFVQQMLEFLPNFEMLDAYRIFSESSVVVPLSGAIALKASYVVRFDNVPEPGFRKSDRVLTTGIQLNW